MSMASPVKCRDLGALPRTRAYFPEPTDEEIKFYLAGNICRCTGYNKITAAVRSASHMMQTTGMPAVMGRIA